MIADFIAILLAFAAFYFVIELRKLHEAQERRIKALERREPVNLNQKLPEKMQPGLAMYPPIENFTPKKPETLRPNQVRGREVEENVYEFDSKL